MLGGYNPPSLPPKHHITTPPPTMLHTHAPSLPVNQNPNPTPPNLNTNQLHCNAAPCLVLETDLNKTCSYQKLSVHHVRFFPGVGEHSFQINLFVAVRAGLFLAHNAPPADAKLVEPEKSKQNHVTKFDKTGLCM